MEEKVDYSKDIQVTIDNNQTFPAKLLALANGSLFDLIGGWWYKCVIEGLTWVFQFEEIKTTGDVIASLVINVESGIC